MIDVYGASGTFADPNALARELAATLMRIEQVPDIPMFRQNTAAFVRGHPDGALSNVEGNSTYVRVQVLINPGALDRDKQLAVVQQFTNMVARPLAMPRRPPGPGCCSQRRWRAGGDSPGMPPLARNS